jgi:hypothetical protein
MSKYNPYDDYEMARVEPVVVLSKQDQFTIGELLHILREIVRENPAAADLPIFHVVYGGIVPSRKVEIPPQGDMMVIDQ